jgi:outer membrane protein TolC
MMNAQPVLRRIAAITAIAVAVVGDPARVHAQATEPLTLERAIEMALQRGPSARAMASFREAARWRDRAFASRLLPQLSVGGQIPVYRREIVPVVQPDGSQLFVAQEQRSSALTMSVSQVLPYTGGSLFVNSGLSNVNTVGQQETRLWRSTPFQVGISQDIFRLNTWAWDAREQDIRLDVAERQYLETRENIAMQAAALFFDVFATRTALINAESNASVNDTLFTLNKGRLEVGRIGENDLLQSELRLLDAQTRLDQARLDADRAAAALRLYLGLPPDAPVDVQVTNVIPTIKPDTALAMREALKNAAAIRELDLQDVQNKRRVSEARRSSAFNATVTAGVGFNQSSQNFDGVYRDPLQSQNFAVGVQVPVLSWGGRKAQIEAARADQMRTTNDARLAREQRAQDAIYAARGLELAERRLTFAAKADTVGAKRFEVARNRYTIGRIDISNLFIAQGEKDQALQGYVNALRGYWNAYYQLRRLTLYDFVKNEPIR